MSRVAHKVFWWASGTQHWTRRRFTPAGRFVLGCLIVTSALGIDTDLTLAYQLFCLALALVVFAFLATLRFRPAIRCRRELPAYVTAGERFTYRVCVSNEATRTERGLELVDGLADPRPAYDRFRRDAPPWWRRSHPHWRRLVERARNGEIEPLALPALGPGQAIEVTLEGLVHHRGYLRFARLGVARADPLGLCRALRDEPAPASLLVLPRRYDLPEFALPGSRTYQHGGVTLAASKGDSEEFVGLRDYRAGDPLKHVHWKSFARTGRPVVKEYQDEYFERHALVLDTFLASGRRDRFEEAVSVAASFVCTLETQENLLDLMFIGDRAYTFTAGLGQLHTDGMLEVLAGVQPAARGDLDDLRRSIEANRAGLSGCILVLLAWDAPRRRFVEGLQALDLPVRVFVVHDADDEVEARDDLTPLRTGHIQEGLTA